MNRDAMNRESIVHRLSYLLVNGRVIDPVGGFDRVGDVFLRRGRVEAILAPRARPPAPPDVVVDASGLVVCPGLVDIHVHLREPGQTHKEDIASGTLAAALGGVTALVCMPNTTPPADAPGVLSRIRERATEVNLVKLFPAGALTEGLGGRRLTDFAALKAAGAVALTDDGNPLPSDALMESALRRASRLGLPVLSHCEPEIELAARDIALSAKTGCSVHICHVSRRETVDLIRAAKAQGVRVTAETCPHYLHFTHADTARLGPNAKMNPPLGAPEDREAVIQGLADGALDAIATDHAPHHPSEKAVPFEKAPNGVIGLETLLPAALEALYHTGRMGLSRLLALMTNRPAAIAGLPAGRLSPGCPADVLIFDPCAEVRVDAGLMASRSRNTPFDGMALRGQVVHVFADGLWRIQNGRRRLP